MNFSLFIAITIILALPKNETEVDVYGINPEKVQEAKNYCIEKELNTQKAIFIDMTIHSGKKRLFLYDFKADSIIMSSLCAHGCCDNLWGQDETKTDPEFSNIPDSHCSSIGKYKIGKRGYSNWGINVNYKLHGLEQTNNNAYKRIIVLHSWNEVSEVETFPIGTPEGWGCPAISNQALRDLDPILEKSKKPILLWIYNN
ncbi:murein L,D-transpeptidase catalytic domain-containing protein [Crocinitomix catalasitica]|uniref:murein L,D-transpeptidase catalytic domain-containing protein n=1 Tax=Crocinitomix catalasitica TaxID=184607 RepID=UPI000687546B|nr:murein L,D-transpeptidase catalytic domain family protein [Crocinitomix catalasitica]